MKKWYLKLDGDIVRDIIEYPYGTYVEVELPEEYVLPTGILGGYYRWDGASFVFDQDLKNQFDEENKPYGYDELTSRMDLMQKALDDVILGGAL